MDAVTRAFDEMGRGMLEVAKAAPEGQGLRAIIERYLSTPHVNSPGMACVVAALGPELARRPSSVRRPIERSLESYRERLLPFLLGESREEKLVNFQLLFASMAGVLASARVTASPERREQIVSEARKFFVKTFTEGQGLFFAAIRVRQYSLAHERSNSTCDSKEPHQGLTQD